MLGFGVGQVWVRFGFGCVGFGFTRVRGFSTLGV